MANRTLFRALRGALLPPADTVNEAGGVAYARTPEHALAQYAATGCLNATFYASAEMQLAVVLTLCEKVSPEFIARTALYARQRGHMKDLPALLCAVLSVRSPGLMAEIFDRVIDTPKMLRNFVQIMRSGAVGRKSLGTLPKRMILQWLEQRSDRAVFFASIGNQPSLADIVRMVHPKPATASREALYGYLLGREHAFEHLPEIVREFEQYKNTLRQRQPQGDAAAATEGVMPTAEVAATAPPDVPFQMLTALPLDAEAWRSIARNATWQTTRMNINTFVRHGVFEDPMMIGLIAARLADPSEIARSRVLPYQLLTAFAASDPATPRSIRVALKQALEHATRQVPEIPGKTYVFVDISGSMQSALTGERRGATSVVRCLEVAALMAASILRRNPDAEVLAFHDRVEPCRLDPDDTVMTNAALLARLPSGGTDCSAPMRELNARKAMADTVIYVSDNQSWVDTKAYRWNSPTGTMQEWMQLRQRCPNARLICIDLQPGATAQAPDLPDVLNIGGFSDAVFEVVADFACRGSNAQHWVDRIEAIAI